jgi:hypothetical protein
MRRVQINKGRRQHAGRGGYPEDGELLPLDARDPDIVRAKRLQSTSRPRTRPARESSRT